jgi:hypothetical protein
MRGCWGRLRQLALHLQLRPQQRLHLPLLPVRCVKPALQSDTAQFDQRMLQEQHHVGFDHIQVNQLQLLQLVQAAEHP